MTEETRRTMPFVAMTNITKTPSYREEACTDWVATEKVHGSSFQFFTNDGNTVHLGSRRNPLDYKASFLKCGLKEFRQRHVEYVRRMFQAVKTDERWLAYRVTSGLIAEVDVDENEEEVDDDNLDNEEERVEGNDAGQINVEENVSTTSSMSERLEKDIPEEKNEEDSHERINEADSTTRNTVENGSTNSCTAGSAENDDPPQEEINVIELRIYGELYGGGGVNSDIKSAVQKEIIYSDEFRFYVFGVNINRKWTTTAEMNDLCKEAGFPYYAIPVCEPQPTLDDLKEWLTSSGFITSRSRLTERTDNFKTTIEGVVMTPLTRKEYDYKLHPIKLLSKNFQDIRNPKNSNQRPNYCTKARYHAVLSKLDLPERENADMVVDMFIADILKESGEASASKNKMKSWTRSVKAWLAKDGYIKGDDLRTADGEARKEGMKIVKDDSGEVVTTTKSSEEEPCDGKAKNEDTGWCLGDFGAFFETEVNETE